MPVEPLDFKPIAVVEQANKAIDEVNLLETIPVPSNSTNKPYMDYRSITNSSSDQYKLLHGKEVASDVNGIVRISGYTCVALGSQFGNVGSKYIFVFENEQGNRRAVPIIKADEKQDRHTLGGQGWIGENGHILEMIVDTNKLDQTAKIMGNCNYIEELEGRIIAIYKE